MNEVHSPRNKICKRWVVERHQECVNELRYSTRARDALFWIHVTSITWTRYAANFSLIIENSTRRVLPLVSRGKIVGSGTIPETVVLVSFVKASSPKEIKTYWKPIKLHWHHRSIWFVTILQEVIRSFLAYCWLLLFYLGRYKQGATPGLCNQSNQPWPRAFYPSTRHP